MSKKGKYIVIEGNDGTGKSTQVALLRKRLTKEGIESVEFHEPAGTPIADSIRTVIKDGSLPRQPETNLLLFTAARHEIWKKAESTLNSGGWVIAARNYYSTLVYQGEAEGVDLDLIRETTRHFTSDRYMLPDVAIILDLDLEQRTERLKSRSINSYNQDTFERRSEKFQKIVNEGYREIAKEQNLPVIDAASSPKAIAEEIWKLIEPKIYN